MNQLINKSNVLEFNENSKTYIGGEKIKLNKKIPVIAIAILTIFVIMPDNAHALEPDTEYFIESDNIVLIISLDSESRTTLIDGIVVINDESQTFDMDSIKRSRISSDGEHGTFLGRTETGSLFYAVYDISDEPKLLIKVWHDGIKTRLVEPATITNLFS